MIIEELIYEDVKTMIEYHTKKNIENREYFSHFMIKLLKTDTELHKFTKQKIREFYKSTDWYKEIIENTKNGIYVGNIVLHEKCYLFLPDLSDIKVTVDFKCSYNKLTSLEGCPREVGGSFFCNNNDLTSLEGCPREVGGHFWCNNLNNLTSLEGSPKEVGIDFNCFWNKNLTSLEGCPAEIGGYFATDDKFTEDDKKRATDNRRKQIEQERQK